MSIPTVYIKGTKAAANKTIAEKGDIACTSYSMFGDNYSRISECPDGTVVKFYDKFVDGNPYAKSYGNWKPAKKKII